MRISNLIIITLFLISAGCLISGKPQLEVNIDKAQCGKIEYSLKLTDPQGEALKNKEIEIYLEDKQIDKVTTDHNGRAKYDLRPQECKKINTNIYINILFNNNNNSNNNVQLSCDFLL